MSKPIGKCLLCDNTKKNNLSTYCTDCAFKIETERKRILSRRKYLKIKNGKGLPAKRRLLHSLT